MQTNFQLDLDVTHSNKNVTDFSLDFDCIHAV